MRYLAATLLALISAQAWANELDSLLQQAQVLGAPMAAVQRAIQDLAPADLSKKDVDGSRRSHGRGSARHSDLAPADLSQKRRARGL
jgi:hypothetical protein